MSCAFRGDWQFLCSQKMPGITSCRNDPKLAVSVLTVMNAALTAPARGGFEFEEAS